MGVGERTPKKRKDQKAGTYTFRLHPELAQEKQALDIIDKYALEGVGLRQLVAYAICQLVDNPMPVVTPSVTQTDLAEFENRLAVTLAQLSNQVGDIQNTIKPNHLGLIGVTFAASDEDK